MRYAHLFHRLAAYAIDSVVLIGIYMAFGLLLALFHLTGLLVLLPMIGFWFFGGMLSASWLYFAAFESSSWQGTLGKRLLGMKVSGQRGERLSFWRASLRYFCKVFSYFLLIGFLMILFTKKRQALHDKLCRTVVLARTLEPVLSS